MFVRAPTGALPPALCRGCTARPSFGFSRSGVYSRIMCSASLDLKQLTTPSELVPRSGHSAATLPGWHSSDAIVVCGYVECPDKSREPTNEAWVLSAKTGVWKKVSYSPGATPRPRLVSQAVIVNDKLWLVGGWDPRPAGTGGDILADVWSLTLNTYEWKQEDVTGEELQTLSRHQAVAVEDKIYIHTHRSIDDILVLHTTMSPCVLQRVPTRGSTKPSSRGLHTVTAVGEKLYLFGGAPKSGAMLGDLWCLDLPSMTWVQLHPSGPAPQPRCAHVAAAAGTKIIFFGGARYKDAGPGLEVLGDWFCYDTLADSWELPQVDSQATSSKPCPRNASALVPCHDTNTLLLFGGWKAFVESYHDSYLVTVKD